RSEGGASQREAWSCSGRVTAVLISAGGSQPCSFQLRVLLLGFLQDGNVGVGFFPERDEVLILGTSLGRVAGANVGTGKAEMGESAQREVQHDAAMVEELLELCSCGGAVVGC